MSFRNLLKKDAATEEEKFDRQRAKAGKVITDAKQKLPQIKREQAVSSWVELMVLLQDARKNPQEFVHDPRLAGFFHDNPQLADEARMRDELDAEFERQSILAATRAQQHNLPPPLPPRKRLYDVLLEFLTIHEPDAVADGRLQATMKWAYEHGVEALNEMLRKQYGVDLFNERDNGPEMQAVDLVATDRLARRLQGFYKSRPVETTFEKCWEVAEWAIVQGVDKLNKKLKDKYGEDMDEYEARIRAEIEPKLWRFYEKHNPDFLNEGRITAQLTWIAANGVQAFNLRLMDQYGEDLDGNRAPGRVVSVVVETPPQLPPSRPIETPPEIPPPPPPSVAQIIQEDRPRPLTGRAVLFRELQKSMAAGGSANANGQLRHVPRPAPPKVDLKPVELKPGEPEELTPAARKWRDDIVAHRKAETIRLLAAFLESKDPGRLARKGGLESLVEWALPRDDAQLDNLLMETYGDDLQTENLRETKFTQDEAKQWSNLPEGPAGRAAERTAEVLQNNRFSLSDIIVPVGKGGEGMVMPDF